MGDSVRIGLKNDPQFGSAREEFLVVSGDYDAGGVGDAAADPVRVRHDQQPLSVHHQVGVGGDVDADQFAVANWDSPALGGP